ncbi:MAG: hypothetical protein MJZ74_01110 [Muribaculaceae bacterium]|nr:hypothetical protein [Muribaculaceae bacterium]
MKKIFLILSIALAAACMANAQDKTYMNVHQPNGEDKSYEVTADLKVTWGAKTEQEENKEDGHRYVDLGLTSGLRWAACNIGAEEPWDYGQYFCWGEMGVKEDYSLGNYTYKDNPAELSQDKDVAHLSWRGYWRMPTRVDFKELMEECTWTFERNYHGTHGYMVTGPNGNSIFLPAGGLRNGLNLVLDNEYGYFWSSSIINQDHTRGWILRYNNATIDRVDELRHYGLPVRPVLPAHE